MNMERMLRAIGGAFVFASVVLGWLVHPYFYVFTAFVGLNLFQSGFTNWCPMMIFLKRLGVRSCASSNPAGDSSHRAAA